MKGLSELNKIVVGVTRYFDNIEDVIEPIAVQEISRLRDEARLRTPIDSGKARSRWSRVMRDQDSFYTELRIPYGFALDRGSLLRHRPWPSPGPKTTLFKGKVYSTQVADGEGGIVDVVMNEERMGKIKEKILTAAYKGLSDVLGR